MPALRPSRLVRLVAYVCLFGVMIFLGLELWSGWQNKKNTAGYQVIDKRENQLKKQIHAPQQDIAAHPTPSHSTVPSGEEDVEHSSEMAHAGIEQDGHAALFSISVQEVGFPPSGISGPVFKGQFHHEVQQKFINVDINSAVVGRFFVLYGATMCEEFNGKNLILVPCIFREIIELREDVNQEIEWRTEFFKTIKYDGKIDFQPWTRYATSQLGCFVGEQFRMSFQYGLEKKDILFSVRVPFSSDTSDALSDLNRNILTPCRGKDIFLGKMEAIRLLQALDIASGK